MVWLGGWLTGPPWSFGRKLCAWRHFNRRDPTSSWRNWRSRKDVDAGKIEQTEKAPGRHEEPEHAGSELGELDGGVEGDRVWMTCTCGATINRDADRD